MKHKPGTRLTPKKPNLLRSLVNIRYLPLTGPYDPLINQKIRKKLALLT
jgi:hypothetical protein